MQKFSVGLGGQKAKKTIPTFGMGFEIISIYLLLHYHLVHHKVAHHANAEHKATLVQVNLSEFVIG
jgi:hypothetical protein